jgi:hypothetical protein
MMDSARNAEPTLVAYQDLYQKTIGHFVKTVGPNLRGDPEKFSERVIDLVKGEGLASGRPFPARIAFGSDALRLVRGGCNSTLQLCKEWEDVATSTDIDG